MKKLILIVVFTLVACSARADTPPNFLVLYEMCDRPILILVRYNGKMFRVNYRYTKFGKIVGISKIDNKNKAIYKQITKKNEKMVDTCKRLNMICSIETLNYIYGDCVDTT